MDPVVVFSINIAVFISLLVAKGGCENGHWFYKRSPVGWKERKIIILAPRSHVMEMCLKLKMYMDHNSVVEFLSKFPKA